MDLELVKKINEKVVLYLNKREESTLIEVDEQLQILQFQIQYLRYKLRIIDGNSRSSKTTELLEFEHRFSHTNAFSAQQLVLPLLMYLFNNHRSRKPAYETSVGFMKVSIESLRPGDFHKSKTGALRFITNTRFASEELRKIGLIRSDNKTFYKVWELSFFGVMVAGLIYKDGLQSIVSSAINIDNDKSIGDFNRDVLKKYLSKADNIESIIELLEYVNEERELFLELLKSNQDKFYEYQKNILQYYKERKTGDSKNKVLIDFVNTSNEDKELSKLADAIKIRKEIELNLQVVYSILNV